MSFLLITRMWSTRQWVWCSLFGTRLALLGDGVSTKRGKYSVEPEAYKERMEAIQNVLLLQMT